MGDRRWELLLGCLWGGLDFDDEGEVDGGGVGLGIGEDIDFESAIADLALASGEGCESGG